jgi:DNA-binding transcriptional regulator LsrR (DeoR family)
MIDKEQNQDREELLADIAEMYYQQGKNQAEISKIVGLTRSAISRLLTEARQKGIVEINIHRPLSYDTERESELKKKFKLMGIRVVRCNAGLSDEELKERLGKMAATELSTLIKPGMTIGISWGTTVKSVINAYEGPPIPDTRVTQLLGVLGFTRLSYSGHTLVELLAKKLGGQSTYLYSPFIVETEDTAKMLKNDPSIKEALSYAKKSDLAILGIGSTKPDYCSLYQREHITKADLAEINSKQAVGDVNGQFFTIDGEHAEVAFHKRLISISREDLANIPLRFAAAGNPEKAEAILGAIRAGFVNYLITENFTAARILELAE